MKSAKFILLGLFLGAITFSCNVSEGDTNENAVAQVGKAILYKATVTESIPAHLTTEDSAYFAEKYISNWITRQLLYQKSLLNIRDTDNTLKEQIENYTQEIYIHHYEQMFVNQKLDTLIPKQQIVDYYEQQKKDFTLTQVAVKPLFLIFPKTIDVARVKRWFYSSNPNDIESLKDFTYQFSSCFYFADSWFFIDQFIAKIPFEHIETSKILSKNGFILEDTAYYYFIKTESIAEKGDYIPLELATDNIAKILIHKRKQELIANMRNKLYNDALHKNEIHFFK